MTRKANLPGYVRFLHHIYTASQNNEHVTPSALTRQYNISNHAFRIGVDLGFFEQADGENAVGSQRVKWTTTVPCEESAKALADEVAMYAKQRNKLSKQKSVNKPVQQTANLSFNGATVSIPVVNNTIEFNIKGTNVKITL